MTKTALENNKPQSPSDQPAHWGRKAGLAVIILLALLLGAGVWVLNDQTRLRSIVENVLSSATDRPFVIDGDFELSLGKQISINATQVRWANASWSATPDMLEAGLQLDLLEPLLHGRRPLSALCPGCLPLCLRLPLLGLSLWSNA